MGVEETTEVVKVPVGVGRSEEFDHLGYGGFVVLERVGFE